MKESDFQNWEKRLMQTPIPAHEPPSLGKILLIRESRRRSRQNKWHIFATASCLVLGCTFFLPLPGRERHLSASEYVSNEIDPANAASLFASQYEEFAGNIYPDDPSAQLQSLTESLEQTTQMANWSIATFNPIQIQEEK